MQLWDHWDGPGENEFPALGAARQNPRGGWEFQRPKTTPRYFSDAALRDAHQYYEQQPVVRILTRKDSPQFQQQQNSAIKTAQPSVQIKSLEEREKEYEKARAAIFNTEPKEKDNSLANERNNYKNNTNNNSFHNNGAKGRGRPTCRGR